MTLLNIVNLVDKMIECFCRSRPDSFISLESDIASEQENDKSEIVEIEVSPDRQTERGRVK